MIIKLPKENYQEIESFFKGLDHNLIIPAIFQGTSPANVFVDNHEKPNNAFMICAEGEFFGKPDNSSEFTPSWNAFLRKRIIKREGEIYIQSCNGFDMNRLKEFNIDKVNRYHYQFNETDVKWKGSLPKEYKILKIDSDLLENKSLKHINHIIGWIAENWSPTDVFLEKGAGFCIVFEDTIVCMSLMDCFYDDKCEIGVVTRDAFQKRGLGTYALASCLKGCILKGYKSIRCHCRTDNIGSVKMNKYVRFKKVLEYPSYKLTKNK